MEEEEEEGRREGSWWWILKRWSSHLSLKERWEITLLCLLWRGRLLVMPLSPIKSLRNLELFTITNLLILTLFQLRSNAVQSTVTFSLAVYIFNSGDLDPVECIPHRL